ncbi:MAG: amidohydrolase family protein [candidate division KSB1 bacterium]|nr:amidohydrolase family protein [candidate division KSB1 bacterium]MDZ7275880.1 amidohydrolase family protein [candidate division KSB1 bacterium]MDZ7287630.1 amidohydrolase family protein [candidate division KSB1 bacterium]MDZ7306792.1 amidohydrolase family protein [candidate division KSB1 bacterium]MDZ7350608.1 amidohydrolase family protein [candidate division KSB1 bacterium]
MPGRPLLSLIGNRGREASLTFINAALLGEQGIIATSLRLRHGRVDAIDAVPGRGDLIVDLGGDLLAPGLINAHDHLEFNCFQRLKWRAHHRNVAEWIADFQPRFATDPDLRGPLAIPVADRLWIGGIKNLLSGVTTVCHHNPWQRALDHGFPVRVVKKFRHSHSLLIDGEKVAAAYRRTPRGWPWIIHLAEGIDAAAAAELTRLQELGCLQANTVLVHGVGLTAADRARVIDRGGALIWCPSSNQFLFGETAQVAELAAAGRVALGSDSRLSGEQDLLAELQIAHATRQVDARALFRMVSSDAARILRLPRAGRLAPGGPADLVVFPARGGDPFGALVTARRAALRLVMIAGRPRLGDVDMAPVFAAAKVATVRARVDGVEKLLAAAIAQRLKRAAVTEPGLEIL